MIAKPVAPHLTHKAWPLIEQWIADALTAGAADMGPEDIQHHLERGSMQLWLAWDEDARRAKGCCITELAESVRGRCCNLVAVAGLDFKQWRPLIETIKAWAIEQDCVRLEAGGREGWQRYVRSDGWRKLRVTIEMNLGQADHGSEQADNEIKHRPLGTDAGGAAEHDPADPAAVRDGQEQPAGAAGD